MDDIWIMSWFNHTAFDANPMWKSPIDNKTPTADGLAPQVAPQGTP